MKLFGRIGAFVLALATLATLLTPAAALEASRPAALSHNVRLTGQIETLSSTGTIGVPGTQDTDAGILDGTVSGSPRWSGALRQVVTWGSGLAIRSKGALFDANGALRFTLAGKFTRRSSGGLALTGKLMVSGGTGSYKRAFGTLRVTGIASVGSGTTSSTFDLNGTLHYPRTSGCASK